MLGDPRRYLRAADLVDDDSVELLAQGIGVIVGVNRVPRSSSCAPAPQWRRYRGGPKRLAISCAHGQPYSLVSKEA